MDSSVSQSGSIGSYLNSDPNIDILWHHSGTGANSAWFMDGATKVGNAGLSSFPGWDLEGINDFNGDGEADILWRNYATGENCVWFMDDETFVSSSNLAGVSSRAWQIAGTGDFNADGETDILWRNNQTGANTVWFMNDTVRISSNPLPLVGDVNWQIAGTGDFNADGAIDILWRNNQTGANTVWFMSGTVRTGGSPLQTVGDVNWQIKGTGDFNADGQTDIVWRNDVTGANTLWFMNGTARASGSALPTVKDTNWQPLVQSSVLPIANSVSSSSTSTSQPQFNIEIDYRFDTKGWFTPARRAVLEAAVDIWEAMILDEFEDVPAGTALHMPNPETGQSVDFNSTQNIDDLLIFVGSQDIASLAMAGASGTWYTGSSLEARWKGTEFEPWSGYISFDRNANWFFDSTPNTAYDIPNQANDFLSVAVHEIGHVLGVSSSYRAFDQYVSSQYFYGPNAIARNGGNPIPLDFTRSHIRDGYKFGNWGENALDPTLTVGTRKLPTVLDLAILDDVGYEVNYSQAYSNLG
ncbi:MAG: FG-GAP-like repeat-containing protein [Thainema sp.]